MERKTILISARTPDGHSLHEGIPIPKSGDELHGRTVYAAGKTWERRVHKDDVAAWGLPNRGMSWYCLFCYVYLLPQKEEGA